MKLNLKEVRQKIANLTQEADLLFTKAESDGALVESALKRDDEINAELKDLREMEGRLARHQENVRALPSIVNPDDVAGAVDAAKAREVEKIKPFKNLGEMCQAVRMAALGQGPRHPGLDMLAAAAGASEAVPSDGGIFVQKDIATDLLQRTYATGEVLSRVNRFPISANSNGLKMFSVDETSRADGSRFGGVQGFWTGEAAPMVGSRPKYKEIKLELHKLTALSYATDELLSDATALSAYLQKLVPQELNFKLEDSFFRGTGAGMPQGFLNAAAKIAVAKETGQLAATIVFQNIVKMFSRMWAPSRANAVWFINQDIEPELMALALPVGTGGIPVYLPANGLSDSPFARLMGRPVIPVEYCEKAVARPIWELEAGVKLVRAS